MRDARPQGRQIRRTGRDRDLARRRAHTPIDVALFTDSLLRVAGAIGLDTLAFVVWNVGTRPPLDVIRDIRGALHNPRALVEGTVAAAIGFVLVVAATVLVVPAIANPPRDLALVELFTFLVALAIEYAIGNDVRALAARRDV